MANEATIFGRHIQKHDIEANWIKAGNAERPFIPKQAEIIVYDKDDHYNYERYKIGDGVTPINELPFADANKQNKLPVNNSGTSSRVWVATNNHYKVTGVNSEGELNTITKVGRQIGSVKFASPVELEPLETYEIDGYTYTEYSARILGDFELYEDNKTISSTMTSAALLARVTELYTMPGDDGETPFVFKDYVRATGNGTDTIMFYWTYPYYFRRVLASTAGQDGHTAKGSGPKTGIATMNNYFSKWHNKYINTDATPTKDQYRDYLISRYKVNVLGNNPDTLDANIVEQYVNYELFHAVAETDEEGRALSYATNNPDTGFYYSLFNVVDNSEPYGETISVRDSSGRIVIEDGTLPFHGVNNKKLEASIATATQTITKDVDTKIAAQNTKITNLEKINPQVTFNLYPTEEQKAVKDMTGWYRIAETPTGSGYWSNIFHLHVAVARSTFASDVVFVADRMSYQSDACISVLSFDSQGTANKHAFDKIRVVYARGNSSQKSYIEVHMNQNATPANAWDGTGTSTSYTFKVETLQRNSYNWALLSEPIRVSEALESGFMSHEKVLAESSWCKVTTPISDLNNVATKTYVDGVSQSLTDKLTDVATKSYVEDTIAPLNDRIDYYHDDTPVWLQLKGNEIYANTLLEHKQSLNFKPYNYTGYTTGPFSVKFELTDVSASETGINYYSLAVFPETCTPHPWQVFNNPNTIVKLESCEFKNNKLYYTISVGIEGWNPHESFDEDYFDYAYCTIQGSTTNVSFYVPKNAATENAFIDGVLDSNSYRAIRNKTVVEELSKLSTSLTSEINKVDTKINSAHPYGAIDLRNYIEEEDMADILDEYALQIILEQQGSTVVPYFKKLTIEYLTLLETVGNIDWELSASYKDYIIHSVSVDNLQWYFFPTNDWIWDYETGEEIDLGFLENRAKFSGKLNIDFTTPEGETKTESYWFSESLYQTGDKIVAVVLNNSTTSQYVSELVSAPIDSRLSETSTNPVQNKAITLVINDLLARIAGLEAKLNPAELAIYFGLGDIEVEDVTIDFINALEISSQASREGKFTTSPDNQYVYFILPKDFCVDNRGNDQVVFTAGIFDGGFTTPRSIMINETEYYIYRSINLLTWNDLTITIS